MVSHLREILRYRDFLYFLIVLDIKRKYRQTMAGVVWVLFQPIMLTLVLVFLFSRWYGQMGGGTEIPYALFTYTALVPWTYFSRALQGGVPRIVVLGALVKKINFPRAAIPTASVFTAAFDMGLAMLGLFALKWYFGVAWTRAIFAFPAVFAIQTLFLLGLTLLMAGANVYYRDVQYALPFFLQILLLATPIIYPASQIPAVFRPIYFINPQAGITELYRWMFLGMPFAAKPVAFSAVAGVGIFAVGAFFFGRWEKRFADVI
ncbi:MAG: ABC transporter permease [Acidobacteriota bacterium]|nr:MAG: ABC transporter permease [Acidobacteriota bacterium]